MSCLFGIMHSRRSRSPELPSPPHPHPLPSSLPPLLRSQRRTTEICALKSMHNTCTCAAYAVRDTDVRRYVQMHAFTHSALPQNTPTHPYRFPHTAAMQVTCCAGSYSGRGEKKREFGVFRGGLRMRLCVCVCVCWWWWVGGARSQAFLGS